MKKVFFVVLLILGFLSVKSQNFSITTTPDTLAFSQDLYSYNIVVDNPESATLSITCDTKPDWLNFVVTGNQTAVLSGVAPSSYEINEDVIVVVSDGVDIKQQHYLLDVQQKVSQAEFDALKKLYESCDGNNWLDNSNWDFSKNNVSSKWFGLSVSIDGRIIVIKLNANNLAGTIPPEIGDFVSLISLNLQNNNLYGSIPKEIGDLTKLSDISFFNNNLSGAIPNEIANLTKLVQIQFSENNLNGEMPIGLSQLTELILLDISSNSISGDFPEEITSLENITNILLGGNEFENVPDFSLIPSLKKLNLSNNHFFFDDIEPNQSFLTEIFRYAPQKTTDFEYNGINNVIFNAGENFSLNINIQGDNNRYQWYKKTEEDEIAVSSVSTSPVYVKTNAQLSHEGEYFCEVTNSVFPTLTYRSTLATTIFNHKPVFETDAPKFAIEEQLYIYDISVTDANEWDDVTITCAVKPVWLNFIDYADGKAQLSGTPQNSQTGLHSVVLEATDGVSPVATKQEFQIRVTDQNDPPIDIQLTNSAIGELSTPATRIGTLSTTDIDTYDEFSYSITGGDGVGVFMIVGSRLYTASTLDYEKTNIYDLKITTTDKGKETFEKIFTINILDENDPPTRIFSDNSTVVENTAQGTEILQFTTVDQDDNEHTYSFATGTNDRDNNKFSLNDNKLIINHIPDFEIQTDYKIKIKSKDKGGAYRLENFLISVENINDTPPVFSTSPYTITWDENIEMINNILTVNAFDPDFIDDITYAIKNAPSFFYIDNKGVIKVIGAHQFDYETEKEISFQIVASDGKLNETETIRIFLNDANETPVFDNIPQLTAGENSVNNTFIITGIDDGDEFANQILTFSVTSLNPEIVPNPLIDYTQGESTARLHYSVNGFIGEDVKINIEITDDALGTKGETISYSSEYSIHIPSINNAPELFATIPYFETYEQENTNITGISIDDKDAEASPILFKIAVTGGYISFIEKEGLNFETGDGYLDNRLEFTGSQSDINNCIADIIFVSAPFFTGNAQISIYVSDQGAKGAGGAKSATLDIAIKVNEIFAPVILQDIVDTKACTDGTVVFSIGIDAYKPTYQWMKGNKALENQITNTLTIENLSDSNVDYYHCIVSNPAGTKNSNYAKLDVKKPDFSVDIEDVPCYGTNSGKIEIKAWNGYDNYRYFIDNEEVNAINTDVYAGNHFVKVTDSEGCQSEREFIIGEVDEIILTVNTTPSPCASTPNGTIDISAEGGVGNLIYVLSDENFYQEKYASLFSNLPAGTYTIKVTDENNCTIETITEVEGVLSAISVTFDETPISCYGYADATLLVEFSGGIAPYQLNWTNNTETHTETDLLSGKYTIEFTNGLPAGLYNITVIDHNNCVNKLNYNLQQPSPLELEIVEQTDEYCAGTNTGSIAVNAKSDAGGIMYSLDNVDYQQSGLFENMNAGSYSLWIKDANNCKKSFDTEINAEYFPPAADFRIDDVDARRAVKFFNLCENVDSIKWDFGDGNTSDWIYYSQEWSVGHIYSTFGDYIVSLVVSNRCKTDTIRKQIHLRPTTDIADNNKNAFEIFPNPATDFVFIDLPNNLLNETTYLIYSISGILIRKELLTEKEINISNLSKGIYIFQIKNANSNCYKKLVIK